MTISQIPNTTYFPKKHRSSHFYERTQQKCFVFIPIRYHYITITLQCALSQILIVLCMTWSSQFRFKNCKWHYLSCFIFGSFTNRQFLLTDNRIKTMLSKHKCEQLTTRHKKVIETFTLNNFITDDLKRTGCANNYEK